MSEVTMTQEEIDPLAPVLADDQPSESRRADAPKIVAIVPVYNEERFIGSVVLKTKEYASTVLVVDDGSTDGTAAVAKAAGAEVIRHEQNQGKGAALNTGFHRARELAADAIVTLDGDGQHFPEELCLVIQPILDGQADIVVGSRYLENTSDVPQRRVWGHRFFNLITNQLSEWPSRTRKAGSGRSRGGRWMRFPLAPRAFPSNPRCNSWRATAIYASAKSPSRSNTWINPSALSSRKG